MNYQKIFSKALAKANNGLLTIKLTDGDHLRFGTNGATEQASIILHSNDFFKKVILGNDIGLGESFIVNDWDTPNLEAVIQWFLANYDRLSETGDSWINAALAKILQASERIQHFANRNTTSGSRKNIEAHYDLGNDFYQLFLDETMAYSSGYFKKNTDTLTSSQFEKFDRLCQKLNLGPEDKVLEIGCGWGGFALYAARNYGCHVTGITISPSQFEFAKKRVIEENLEAHINIELIDYRDVTGTFDKIVSIEMIEAVGHGFLPEYFSVFDRLLSRNGLAAIQVILSANQRYDAYLNSVDYIRKHIFPGSNVPSTNGIFDAIPDKFDFNLYHYESFGLHYARTLREWKTAFERNWSEIAKLGFDDQFRRKWQYYFESCAAAFQMRHINLAQVVWGRSNSPAYRFELGSVPKISERQQVEVERKRFARISA